MSHLVSAQRRVRRAAGNVMTRLTGQPDRGDVAALLGDGERGLLALGVQVQRDVVRQQRVVAAPARQRQAQAGVAGAGSTTTSA